MLANLLSIGGRLVVFAIRANIQKSLLSASTAGFFVSVLSGKVRGRDYLQSAGRAPSGLTSSSRRFS